MLDEELKIISNLAELNANEQRAVVKVWFQKKYPDYADLIFTIPRITGGKLIDTKYSGIPSLLIAVPYVSKSCIVTKLSDEGEVSDVFKPVAGLFIEVKKSPAPGRRLRIHRQQLHAVYMLRKAGYRAYVCSGAEDAMNTIDFYMQKMRSEKILNLKS